MKKKFILLMFMYAIAFSDNVFLKNGEVLRNVFVMDTLGNKVRLIQDNILISISLSEIIRIAPPRICIVTMYDGKSIQGEFVSSTDTTATYQTNTGLFINIEKKFILSVKDLSDMSFSNSPKATIIVRQKKVAVITYDYLPVLVVGVAGGIWAGLLFKDASDYSSAAKAFSALGLSSAADAAQKKSGEKQLFGFGVSIVSLVLIFVGIQSSEHYIEQPITVIPTSDGIKVCYRF